MIELAQHIEKLLLDNDCVVIPGFGGFVVHHTPALWDDEQGLFLPPTRTIGFNPRLTMNDGLLVQSYIESYHTNFSEAARQVNTYVEKLIDLLYEKGEIELINIGILRLDENNSYQFIPFNDKIISPAYYGLDAFNIKPLGDLSVVSTITNMKNGAKKEIKLKNNYSALRYVAAIAAAIVLFFHLSIPVENKYTDHLNQANLLPSELFGFLDNQSVITHEVNILPDCTHHIEPSGSKQLNDILADEKKQEEINKTEVTETELTINIIQNNPGKYHIIVGSLIDMRSAHELAYKLKSQGNPGASILIGNGKIRVSALSFASQNDARNVLRHMRKYDSFKTAWILKK